jgi:hypothetical protein
MAKPKIPETATLESQAYLEGLFSDFSQQMDRYKALTRALMGLEARMEIAEKTLCLTRDHLQLALTTCEGGGIWRDRYDAEAAKVRFIGKRLVDACEEALAQHKKLTPEKLRDALNEGTFRFRTTSPLREIHAALLRHPNIKRVDNYYIWSGPKEDRLAVLAAAAEPAPSIKAVAAMVAEDKTEVKPN